MYDWSTFFVQKSVFLLFFFETSRFPYSHLGHPRVAANLIPRVGRLVWPGGPRGPCPWRSRFVAPRWWQNRRPGRIGPCSAWKTEGKYNPPKTNMAPENRPPGKGYIPILEIMILRVHVTFFWCVNLTKHGCINGVSFLVPSIGGRL